MAGKQRDFGRENRFLLATIGGDADSRARPMDVAALDWGYVLAAANLQGITPLLARWAEERPTAVPAHVAAELRALYWTTHFQNRALLRQLERILAAAAHANIPLMPLKGGALVAWYYPAPGLRPMSDLDFLCQPGDEERVADLLLGLGFTPVSRPPWTFFDAAAGDTGQEHAFVADMEEGQVLVEFRTEAFDPTLSSLLSGDRAMMAALNAQNARFWERARPEVLRDATCPRITPEDLLLHVTSHMTTRHAGLRLLWLHDVRMIVEAHAESLDWEYLIASARALHLDIPIRAALVAAHDLLAAPIPPSVLDQHDVRGAGYHRWWAMAERRHFRRRARAVAQDDLTAIPAMSWWVTATLGRFSTGREMVRALGRMIVPPEPYMAVWSGVPCQSKRRYWRAVWLRVCYLTLGGAGKLAALLRIRPIARGIARSAERIRA